LRCVTWEAKKKRRSFDGGLPVGSKAAGEEEIRWVVLLGAKVPGVSTAQGKTRATTGE